MRVRYKNEYDTGRVRLARPLNPPLDVSEVIGGIVKTKKKKTSHFLLRLYVEILKSVRRNRRASAASTVVLYIHILYYRDYSVRRE